MPGRTANRPFFSTLLPCPLLFSFTSCTLILLQNKGRCTDFFLHASSDVRAGARLIPFPPFPPLPFCSSLYRESVGTFSEIFRTRFLFFPVFFLFPLFLFPPSLVDPEIETQTKLPPRCPAPTQPCVPRFSSPLPPHRWSTTSCEVAFH